MSIFFRAVVRLVRIHTREEDAVLPETFNYDKGRLLRMRNDVLDAVNIVICTRVYEHVRHMVCEHQGETQTNNLCSSLVDILQSTSGNVDQAKRWVEAVPHMAVKIFRYAKAPSYMLATVESALGEVLSNPHGELFLDVKIGYHRRLLKDLCNRVREYKGMNSWSLYTAAVEKRVPPGGNMPRDFYECLRDCMDMGVSDLAMRLAHVGILHWRSGRTWRIGASGPAPRLGCAALSPRHPPAHP
jgi:hypothetical protein